MTSTPGPVPDGPGVDARKRRRRRLEKAIRLPPDKAVPAPAETAVPRRPRETR